MKKKKTNTWTIILFVSLIILVVMSLVSNAIEIGERLGGKHIILEIAFYILIAIVVLGGIVYPLVGVFFVPIFSLKELHNADGTARRKWCRRLTDNLLENVELTEEEREQVKGYLKMGDETDDRLIEFFDRKIAPELNREIFDTAKKIFIITAVSQNSVYDMLGMASANFTLIKRITEICGFRPSNAQVLGLYIRVLSMTLIAGNLEEMNLEELIPMATESALGKALGIVAASATQGAVNALTTLRMAAIAKNYLLNADVSQTRKELRKKSYAEAFVILRDILKQGMEEKVKNPVKNFFGRKKDQENISCIKEETVVQ
ncbi:MAG: YcjF family protein [Lachnospiraceae bacterium]|nr:YcjF family protein [Lachnospiraceae bacterium]